MGRGDILVGIEIGTSKVCVVVGEDLPDGGLEILGVGQAPSRGVRKGEIVDFATAHQCLNDALNEAEEKTDVTIFSVYLAVTGAHIIGCSNRGQVNLGEEPVEIQEEDVKEAERKARKLPLNPGEVILHGITQRYYVDGRDGVLNPVGMLGCVLDADFHLIRAVKARVQNSVRCVKEFNLEVKAVVASMLAASRAVLSRTEMGQGALVIDMGAGTTDFIAFADGVPVHSGVLAIGGDHITNDISIALRIPISRAERLKVEDGGVSLDTALPGETITLKDEGGFVGREIDRSTLNQIMHARVRETLELLRRNLEEKGCRLMHFSAGVFLTGGCSQIDGIRSLAEDVFGLPVTIPQPRPVEGVIYPLDNPLYSTAVGLLKHVQFARPTTGRNPLLGGVFGWLFGWLFGWFRGFFHRGYEVDGFDPSLEDDDGDDGASDAARGGEPPDAGKGGGKRRGPRGG